MKQQHGKYDVKNYSKGVNSDVSKELISELPEGFHADSLNMRSLAQDGDNLGKTHIGGESGFYPAIDTRDYLNQSNPSTINFINYSCVMTQSINGHIVEIWCSKDNFTFSPNPSEPSFIRIDGEICLMSVNFPVYHDKPLQYDKNESVLGGVFYITDFHSQPMTFNLQDLIDSYNTKKYFEFFNLSEYTIAIQASLYKPQFIDLVNSNPNGATVIGSAGLPVGQYSYSYRYVSASGDFSSFSPLTDLIPVIINKNSHSPLFSQNLISANPDISVNSTFAPYIKLRFVNNNDFASIEIIRHCWQSGGTIDTPPISYIIHTYDISSIVGVGIFSFIDRQSEVSAMTSITYKEANLDVTSIVAAKSIRFYNKRLYLMNLKYKSKDIVDELNLDTTKSYIFPTIQKLYKEGHSNAYNAAMYKSFMRGERQGYGILLYDNNGSPTYVTPLPTGNPNNKYSYQHPNRRSPLSLTDSKGTSYEGAVTAMPENDKNGTAVLTHEVFDHENAVSRTGFLSYDICGNADTSVVHPTNQNDGSFEFGKPNVFAMYDDDTPFAYAPKAFGLDYYSLGIAVKDIEIPAGFSGFSIVKTKPAKRVVAQGLAMYNFSNDDACHVYFPDLEKLDTISLNQLYNNPSSFQLEIVSAMGFFSECYAGRTSVNAGGQISGYLDRNIDMISFFRVLKEDGTINPTEYTGHVKYNSWFGSTSDVDVTTKQIFDIEAATSFLVGPGLLSYSRLTLSDRIYNHELAGVSPVYVVNLIQNTNDVSDETITEYTSTGHFQKNKSLIGTITTQTTSSFPLISERWEDCINKPFQNADNNFNSYYSIDRYVHVENLSGDSKPWLNITYKTTAEINVILTDITTNGFYQSSPLDKKVYGVYKDNSPTNTESLQRNYELIFEQFDSNYNINLFIPKPSESIYVMYDDRIPSRVFGGDTYVNECIWAHIDAEGINNIFPYTDGFRIPSQHFPYQKYQKSPGMTQYFDVSDAGNPDFMAASIFFVEYIRQLICMFTAETRVPLCFAFEAEPSIRNSLSKFYPLKNYVPRPYSWDNDNPNNGNIDPQYFVTYGNEQDYWKRGGFKYIQTINQDYINRNNLRLFTSVPKLGFEEQTHYPTRIAWSEEKNVNQQNSPSTKTFLVSNILDLSDNNGEIKFAWSAMSDKKGQNLYAITSNGIALVIADKRIINDINAEELFSGSTVNKGAIDYLWLTQTIGMTDEYWRSWAEYNNALFFFNDTGVYALASNQIEFLSEKGGFQEIYKNRVIPYIGKSVETKMSGVFNVLTKEYIMTFDESVFAPGSSDLLPSSLIYGVTQQALQCRASYNYDKYLSIANKLYGMRGGATFRLGEGNIVDGKFMVASVTGVSTGKKGRYEPDVLYHSKEFIRIRVNSNHKPNRILFYDNYENYINGIVSSTVDSDAISYSIKDYGGYECYIPRKALAPHLRQQGRVVLFRIENDTNEDFTINATMVQFKVLK